MLASWGEDRFLMPHGLTVDSEDSLWLTDVGLHQALKFDRSGKELQALGVRLEPGSGPKHLCKPTHVSSATLLLHCCFTDDQRGTKRVSLCSR